MPTKRTSRPILRRVSTFFVVGAFVFLSQALSVSRGQCGDPLLQSAQTANDKYLGDLEKIAKIYDDQGHHDWAKKTREVFGQRDSDKFYLPILPVDVGPAPLPADASDEMKRWNSQLYDWRQDFSNALYDLSKRAVRANRAGLALEWILKAVWVNPDHEGCRRLLGYQKYQNQWRTLYEIRKLRAGMLWDAKFGWVPKGMIARYDEGKRPYEGRWINASEDARLHRDIRNGWVVETEHYSVRTNHSIEAGVALGLKLENLYRLWSQMFVRFYATDKDLTAWFEGKGNGKEHREPAHKFKVAFYRDRADYNRELKSVFPNVEITTGVYVDTAQTAYFFADGEDSNRTLYHEGTHQLFEETRKNAADPGGKSNFWIVEGVAMYMETLREENGFFVMGGFDDDRVIAAQYRFLTDHFYVPSHEFAGYGRRAIQQSPKIATLYSQAAGLSLFLAHFDGGRYRDAMVDYISLVYAGKDRPNSLSALTGESFSELDSQYKKYMEAHPVTLPQRFQRSATSQSSQSETSHPAEKPRTPSRNPPVGRGPAP